MRQHQPYSSSTARGHTGTSVSNNLRDRIGQPNITGVDIPNPRRNGEFNLRPRRGSTGHGLNSDGMYSIHRINNHYHAMLGKKHSWSPEESALGMERFNRLSYRRKSMGDMGVYLHEKNRNAKATSHEDFERARNRPNQPSPHRIRKRNSRGTNFKSASEKFAAAASGRNYLLNASTPERSDSETESENISCIQEDSEVDSSEVYHDASSDIATDGSSDADSTAGVTDSDFPSFTGLVETVPSLTESDRKGVSNVVGNNELLPRKSGLSRMRDRVANSTNESAVVNASGVSSAQAARIRRGYLDRLGIGGAKTDESKRKNSTMGIHARRAAMASARTRRKPPSSVEPLKHQRSSGSGFGKSIIRRFTAWMGAEESDQGARADEGRAQGLNQQGLDREELVKQRAVINAEKYRKAERMRAQSQITNGRRSVAFLDRTNVFFVPSRFDIPPRSKSKIWHTRDEFIEMVMRNMDEVEQEMQQQAEIQARLDDIRNNPPPSLRRKR
mmetsp:Transcript_6079/g.7944  ORF Transcript_6079/g.7944 Transcript_6079/m.7944 type:complete len:502 (-) Transcript_6079:442-1947(-)